VSSFSRSFLDETRAILARVDDADVDAVVEQLRATRDREGRVFFCGSGGGAGHASHATCDFRKLAHIECYCVNDNTSELTARINDDGWDRAYADWLVASRLAARDCLFVFSVGGGDEARNISANLVGAMRLAQEVGASIVGIAGRDGGMLRATATASVLIPTEDPARVTPQTEGLQALVWHLMVSHPRLAAATAKWESVTE
jgi:D-sedoheptulose 7-phosphate isomerase